MKSKTAAIIISHMNLGEADKLVTFFSLDRGMLKGVAKNARKSFKRFGAGSARRCCTGPTTAEKSEARPIPGCV